MDDATKKMLVTVVGPILRKLLITAGSALATHGIINSSQTETFVSIGMALIGLGWSFWNDYGRAIVLSQLEVLKAKSLAQAAKLQQHDIAQPTNEQIADKSATLTTAQVTKVAATLCLLLAFGLMVSPALAQNKFKATGNLPADIKAAVAPSIGGVTLTGNVEKDAKAIWDKIITSSNTDLTYASAMAASANTAASKVRKQCWDAIIAVNKQANGIDLKNADGTPMVKPDPALFTNLESLAEVVDNLSPQGQLYTSCSGAAQLAKRNVLEFINAAVTGAAAIATGGLVP